MNQKRILCTHRGVEQGESVIYTMSRDQRVRDNHALHAAQQKAFELSLPLVVVFNIHSPNGVRAYEHAHFMLRGLEEIENSLKQLNIPFVITAEKSDITLERILQHLKPAAVYFDFSPLTGPRNRLKNLESTFNFSTYVVDTHNIIPVWIASNKQEFSARTFRYKVHAHLASFMTEPQQAITQNIHDITNIPSMHFKHAYEYIKKYPIRNIDIQFAAGESAARKQLDTFIDTTLQSFAHDRNNIANDHQSNLSPYLHFGQISSLRIALEVLHRTGVTPLLFEYPKMATPTEPATAQDGVNALFEEMIVRKELSDNFCFYAQNYRSFESIPDWAQDTLQTHTPDNRKLIYSKQELEAAATHDVCWNAAQTELLKCGKIHGYMRMYWAKKILEWTSDPKIALETTIYLNDAYSIDGGDPNGYAGILWAIGGLHDRPWAERPIFGKVRYMNEAGLRRKFDINKYIQRVRAL